MSKEIWTAVGTSVGFMFVGPLVLAVPVYYLWNWLMPGLFQLPAVTFLQAAGLSVLGRMLFSSSNYTSQPKDYSQMLRSFDVALVTISEQLERVANATSDSESALKQIQDEANYIRTGLERRAGRDCTD